MTTIKTGRLALPGSPLAGENPQPLFRGDPSAAGILPYTRQDRYTRNLRDMVFDSVVMENEFLRAEFLPSLGGRLWSLFDKKARREVVYRNPAFRPANLAVRGAWFSGGVGWGLGPPGRGAQTCSPVFAGVVGGGKSSPPMLRIWEFERQSRLFWRVDFSLSDRAPILYAYMRIENPDGAEKPLIWWTAAAVPHARALSAPEEGRGDFPWSAAVQEDGYAFAEASTPPLCLRGISSWGEGGRRWEEFLSLPEDPGYLELRAGLAPARPETGTVPPFGTVDFAQALAGLSLDRDRVFGEDCSAACGERLAGEIGPPVLAAALERGRARCGEPPGECLSQGSGWGALECRARPASLPGSQKGCGYPPAGLAFPAESIGRAEKPWLALINTGSLPSWPVNSPPPGFPGIQAADLWQPLLLLAPRGGWLTPFYLGVIDFERGDPEKAMDWWVQSLRAELNPWALRNLAVAELRRGDAGKALEYYRGIFERFGSGSADSGSAGASLDRSFMEEFIDLLIAGGLFDEAFPALENYAARKGIDAVLDGPLGAHYARLAFARRDDALLDRIFAHEPPYLREGDEVLSDLWMAREIRRLSESGGLSPAEAERRVEEDIGTGKLLLPRAIDFRMHTGGQEDGPP